VARADVNALGDDNEQLAETVDRLQRRADHDDARLSWSFENNVYLRQRCEELAEQNTQLLAEQSSSAHRLVERYRSTVERYIPNGSYRRRLYETALGRTPGVAEQTAPEAGPVTVTTSESPIVSVVVPVYGCWAYTRRCLAAIETHLQKAPIVVIVVDDASTDGSATRVSDCPGVRLVVADRNRGFVDSCNLGAAHSRGELLMFLNNDTEVSADWLEPLVDVLDQYPGVGIVGSQLVYPDGRLQESGAIVWSDGTGWNYGRDDRPDEPRYRAVREVDYCSGAALLVRAALFESLGGFDTRYAPAYYE